MTESVDRYRRTKIFASLDGLRAVAILAVLWHHAGQERWALPMGERGFLGVDLFFVISGFLISTLLLREQQRGGGISLRHFYGRRALRILPLYWLFLGVVFGVALLLPVSSAGEIRSDLPFAFFFVSNIVPLTGYLEITWSLSMEEQFYLLMPALQARFRRAMPFLLPALYVTSALPVLGFFPSLKLSPSFRGASFGPVLLGVMLAHILNNHRGYRLLHRLAGWRHAPFAFAAILAVCVNVPANAAVTGWPRLMIHGSLAALICSCVIREDHSFRPLMSSWPMRRIGATSYGIYLYHLFVLYVLQKLGERAGANSQALVFAELTLCAWIVAEFSMRYYESRFLALKQGLR